MKKAVVLLLGVFLLLSCCSVYAQEAILEMPEIKIIIDGEQMVFPNAPIATSGRTLLPVRWTVAALGVPNDDEHIIWNPTDQSVTVKDKGLEIYLKINDKKAKVNGKEILLDVPLLAYNERTYVPIRFVSEALQKTVLWDGDIKGVFVRDEVEFENIKKVLNESLEAAKSVNKHKVSATINVKTSLGMDNIESITELYKTERIFDGNSKDCYILMSLSNSNNDSIKQEFYVIGNTLYAQIDGQWQKVVLKDEDYDQILSMINIQNVIYYHDTIFSTLKNVSELSNDKQIVFRGNIYNPYVIDRLIVSEDSLSEQQVTVSEQDWVLTLYIDKATSLLNRYSIIPVTAQGNVEEGTVIDVQLIYNPEEIKIVVPESVINNAVEASHDDFY